MKVKVLKESDEKIFFYVRDASVDLVNALRRTIISELPAFAIDEVDFFENTSPVYNEYLANRIGLIPLTFDESVGDDARIVFALDADGPATVYSWELKSTDDKIRVFLEKIPLIKLAEGQKLKLEATAVKGIGKTHAKFQSAIASYNYVPDAETNSVCLVHAKEFNLFDSKIVEKEKCDICRKEAREGLKFKKNEFIMFVESFNNLTAREQLNRGLEVLKKKAEALKKEI